MPRLVTPLTDTKVKNAKPGANAYKLSDGGGMYLLVDPKGGKYWRLKYRIEGREKLLAFGVYPEVSLADAREKRDLARKRIANGIDPSAARKALKAAKISEKENGFEIVAREWYDNRAYLWAASHAKTVIARLRLDVFPVLGARTIGDIKAPEVLAMLRRIESRGALEVAHRIKALCGQVFRYAVATGRAERDPTADLKGSLKPYKGRHLAAITDPKEVGPLLRAIDGHEGSSIVKWALQLAPLVFVRPGELRQAGWTEIDLDAAEWTIPTERMKMKQPHLVPLSAQAVAILKEAQALTGSGSYVFPSHRSRTRPMSNNAVLAALRRMGFAKDTMTAHGFRAMARTILEEVLQVRPDIIEHQLGHAVRDPLGRAYNRTSHLPERRKMMQLWANYLDELKGGAKVGLEKEKYP